MKRKRAISKGAVQDVKPKNSKPAKRRPQKEMEGIKQMAFVLYMSGMAQNDIAEYSTVSTKTVSDWAVNGKWKEKRAASTITRPELVNKILTSIGNLLDKSIQGEDVGNLDDRLSKFAKTIEVLDRKSNPVEAMELFQMFNKHLTSEIATNPAISVPLIKTINSLQMDFIGKMINNE